MTHTIPARCEGWRRNLRRYCGQPVRWAIRHRRNSTRILRCTPCARGYRFDLNGLGWNRDWIVERLMDDPPARLVA